MQSTAITIAALLSALTLVSCDSSSTTSKTDSQATGAPQTGAAPSAAVSSSPSPNVTSSAVSSSGASSSSAPESSATEKSEASKTLLPSGLAYSVLREGQGDVPKLGSTVLIHCVGRLSDGKEFWNTRTAGVPDRFVLSYDQLITGVLEALLSMKPGERRQLHIPSELGYGEEGYYKIVPPRADLDMDLELVSIEP